MYALIPDMNRRPRHPMMNDPFFRPFFAEPRKPAPFRVDVRETPDAFLLEAELPGVPMEDVSLTVDDGVLTIAAEFNSQRREDREGYLYTERRCGRRMRAFSLEGVKQEEITATARDGVLTVTLPKEAPAEKAGARKIAITAG